ncbi:threonine/serine dehydratase [Kribbella solani]|uniref:threonine/serine dehydratase n=1 Tax=Kribbella solani TaxID=236067 RepID=UPI0029A366D5|nr:threonine/serine dehydratase [Kribbella solani]MDX2968031.1 threonine/serine dehydratase [Kribbella solani]MDX3005441.1 threonine/serine dehydratase [Kribbella solani]
MTVSVDDVRAAAQRIEGWVRRTPVIEVAPGLTFKLELLQHTGSFKARGAFNRLLAAKDRGELTGQGIVAASGGNHALAAAYAARELGVPARIFVPETTPAAKLGKLRTLGAEIVLAGSEYAEAYQAAETARDESGALLVHAYDQPEIVAGQGTVGLELLDQAGAFDTVLVAVGGGGLIAGIATAIGRNAQVIGVEPVLASAMHRALEAGAPTDGPVGGVAADSLGARRLGELAFTTAREHGVRSVLVEDDAIVAARKELWRDHHLAAEHGGATAYAALTSGVYRPAADERVVVVVCGANTDPSTLT